MIFSGIFACDKLPGCSFAKNLQRIPVCDILKSRFTRRGGGRKVFYCDRLLFDSRGRKATGRKTNERYQDYTESKDKFGFVGFYQLFYLT